MTSETSSSFQIPEKYYTTLFNALPGIRYLLQNNAPHFTILAVTDSLLDAVGLTRESLVGRNLLETFPSNLQDEADTGQANLLASLLHVVAHKEPHQLPTQRYDVMDESGQYVERYWRPENRPVLSPDGELVYIIHTSEEITAQIKAEKREVEVVGIEKAFDLFMEAPMVVGLVNGDDYVLELANKEAFRLWGKGPEIIGKPILEALPEVAEQGVIELLDQVRNSGEPFFAHEVPVTSYVDGKEEQHYFNLVYQPYYNSGSLKPTGVFTISHDVTEQVKARQSALESEERFRSMADASPVMIWTLDQAGNSTYYNTKAAEFTGHKEEDLREGKSWQVAIHPDDIEYASSVVCNAVINRIPYQMECRMQRADGEWRWLLNHGTPRFGKNGEYFGFVGSSIDITDRKTTEEALYYRKALLEAQNEAVPDAILIVDTKGKMISYNRHFATLWNIPQQIIDAKDDAAALQFAMTQVADPEGFIERVNYCYAHPDETCTEEVLFKDGRIIERYGNAVLGDNGINYGWIWYFRDITERKKAEQALEESESRFRSLADHSPMFVFIIEPDPVAPVNYWNKTWLEYTGQTLEEARGRAWDGIIHPDDVPLVMEIYVPAFQSRQPYFIPAVRTKRFDGTYRWHAFKGNPLYSADGNFNGYIGVGFDVHEQKIAEEKLEALVNERTKELAEANNTLQKTNKELQRSNQNLEEFAHAASHDLKEPVRKIHFFTQRLKEQLSAQLSETDARSFSRIENATQRMGNLIDDLLLYSHVSQRPHETESIDLAKKVQNVLEDLELDIEEKKAQINIEKLPIVNGYRRQLQQLFQNLLSNALKYSKKDVPPRIDITASKVTENQKPYHLIAVKDNGIGFAPEYTEKIFQMFTRLHGKAEYSGTGVGLSIVKKVVENHNGYIRVKSKPGEGSIFEIYLPV